MFLYICSTIRYKLNVYDLRSKLKIEQMDLNAENTFSSSSLLVTTQNTKEHFSAYGFDQFLTGGCQQKSINQEYFNSDYVNTNCGLHNYSLLSPYANKRVNTLFTTSCYSVHNGIFFKNPLPEML